MTRKLIVGVYESARDADAVRRRLLEHGIREDAGGLSANVDVARIVKRGGVS